MALLASTHGACTKVSPEVVWGDIGTMFLHPEMVVMSFDSIYSYLRTGCFALGHARQALYSSLQCLRERVLLAFTQP